MAAAPLFRPFETQRPDAAPSRLRLGLFGLVSAIGQRIALPHQRRVDLGIALPATCQPTAVAIGARNRATDIAQRQHGGERAPCLPPAGDFAAIAVAAALPVFRRVDALQAQLLAEKPERIAVDRLGRSREVAATTEPILQDGACNRQKQNETKGYGEVDR